MLQAADKKLFRAADIAMITTCFLWALGTIVVKNAIGTTPETFRIYVFNGLRIPAASFLLFGAAKLSGTPITLRRTDLPLIIGVSFFGAFLHLALSMAGLALTSASNMGIIFATIPFFILLVSFVTGIERPSKVLVLGIFIGMSGFIALTWQDGKISVNTGDLLILLSCVFWAIYTVYGKKILLIYSPVVAMAWVFLFTSFFHLPLFFYQLRDQSLGMVSTENWINLVIATVGSYFIANTLFYYSIHKIGPVRVGLYSNLEPVFTLVLAAMIRGENITLLQITGFIVILIGVGITKFPARAQPVLPINHKHHGKYSTQ